MAPARADAPPKPRARRATPAPAPPATPATWLKLMRLASPALPVGGFSYSEGLEAAHAAGAVHDAASLQAWLLDQLHLVQACAELPLLLAAQRAWQRPDRARLRALHDWLLLTRETPELRLQAEQMGRSLARWLRTSPHGDDPRVALLDDGFAPAPLWTIAFALAGLLAGAQPHETAHAYAFGWAENQVQAALKTLPLGQRAAQPVLQALQDAIPAAVAAAQALPPAARQAHAPMLAILAAHHEHQYSRLFRS